MINRTVVKRYMYCFICFRILFPSLQSMCMVCGIYVMPNHQCFTRKLKFSDDKQVLHSGARSMFFDYETYVNADKELVPNLAVVQHDDGEEFTFQAVAL